MRLFVDISDRSQRFRLRFERVALGGLLGLTLYGLREIDQQARRQVPQERMLLHGLKPMLPGHLSDTSFFQVSTMSLRETISDVYRNRHLTD